MKKYLASQVSGDDHGPLWVRADEAEKLARALKWILDNSKLLESAIPVPGYVLDVQRSLATADGGTVE